MYCTRKQVLVTLPLLKFRWKEAESDCTTALQLDKTYVKAYQRRAAAREKLGQLTEAKADLEKVLEYEPKNTESKRALEKLIGNKSEVRLFSFLMLG